DAAMTLMGTWITGYWNGNKLAPGTDYDFFEFPTITEGVPHAALGPVDGLVISNNAKNVDGAEKLLTFLVSNPEAQAKWAGIQGALSANVKVDPKGYSVVMQHALDVINHADAFAFNYDLATPPPVAEVGLSMFAEFMDKPADYKALLEKTQAGAADAFKQ
ncbi:MAG: extracellular solute-binding protein, partial [Devosia sp.]|nr:extracellular solute-binding protein [Devosia sp.]